MPLNDLGATDPLLSDRCWHKQAKTWVVSALLWVVFTCCAAPVLLWNGRESRQRPFELLIGDVHATVNPEAAVLALQAKVLKGIRELELRGASDDRAAMAAREATKHILKELTNDQSHHSGPRPGSAGK